MQPTFAFQPAYISPVPSPVTPLDGPATLPMRVLPHLEVYTGPSLPPAQASCPVLRTPSLGDDEYYVRDMFTVSPSSTPPFGEPPSPLSLGYYPPHASTTPTSPSMPPSGRPASASSPSIAPSRRQARRLSEPACLDDDLVIKGPIAHPYARIYNKKHGAGKRRKMWNHALEKMLFTAQEISTMGAPHRRTIYTASLEAHVDRLHEQLLSYSLAPIPFEKLDPYRGLNAKTAKSMVSGLHHDATELKLKILEMERANKSLEDQLSTLSKHYL